MESELKNTTMQRSNPVKRSEYFNDGQVQRPLPPTEKSSSYPRQTRIVTSYPKQQLNHVESVGNKRSGDAEKISKNSNISSINGGAQPEERKVQSRNEKKQQEASNAAIKRHSLKDPKAIDSSEKPIFIIHRQHDKTPTESLLKSEGKNIQSDNKDNITSTNDAKSSNAPQTSTVTLQQPEKTTSKTPSTTQIAESDKSTKPSDPINKEPEKKSSSTVQMITNERGGHSYVYQAPSSYQSSNNYSKLTTFSTSQFSSKKDVVPPKDNDDDSNNYNNYSNKNYNSSSIQEPSGLVGLRNIGNTCFM